jgi:hypothetical protein
LVTLFVCHVGVGIGALKSKAMSLIGKSASTEDILAQEEEMYPDPPTHAVVSLLVKGTHCRAASSLKCVFCRIVLTLVVCVCVPFPFLQPSRMSSMAVKPTCVCAATLPSVLWAP